MRPHCMSIVSNPHFQCIQQIPPTLCKNLAVSSHYNNPTTGVKFVFYHIYLFKSIPSCSIHLHIVSNVLHCQRHFSQRSLSGLGMCIPIEMHRVITFHALWTTKDFFCDIQKCHIIIKAFHKYLYLTNNVYKSINMYI